MCSLIKVVSGLILVYLSLSQKIAKIKQNYLQAGKTHRSRTRRKETERMPLVFQDSLYLGKLHFCFPHRYTLQAHATSPHSGLGGVGGAGAQVAVNHLHVHGVTSVQMHRRTHITAPGVVAANSSSLNKDSDNLPNKTQWSLKRTNRKRLAPLSLWIYPFLVKPKTDSYLDVGLVHLMKREEDWLGWQG